MSIMSPQKGNHMQIQVAQNYLWQKSFPMMRKLATRIYISSSCSGNCVPKESLTALEAKGGSYQKASFLLPCVMRAYLSGLGKVPELVWMYLEWSFLMICQVQWNCQTWASITSWFLVPEPIKMIYRPQRMESGQGLVKRQGQGSWTCYQNMWHV